MAPPSAATTAPPVRRRLVASVLLVATTTALAGVTMTAQAAVPPPATGWSTVWSDDFTGAAGTLPSAANWIIDTGYNYPGGPANWGTGEIQRYTASTANVSHDGSGNLRITPLRDSAGGWTSARIETVRSDFKAPAGGVLAIEGRIQMPNVTGAAAAGYWPAFWALGAPYRGNYQNWPGIGEFDVMENVNGLNSVLGRAALRRRAGRAVRRVQRHRRVPGLSGQHLPVRVPHLPVRVGRLDKPPATALVRRWPALPHRHSEPGR